MTIEEGLRRLLLSDGVLAALVGEKVFPLEAPQDLEPPYVLYASSDPTRHLGLGGYQNLYDCAVRFDCYGGPGGGSYASAKAVAAAVRGRLFGFFRGPLGPAGEIDCQGVLDDGGEDGIEEPVHGDERGVDYCAVQVRVFWGDN